MQKILIALMVITTSAILVHNVASETLTISTYYPAPTGVYDHLRLHPREPFKDACTGGTFYVRNDTGQMDFCKRGLTGEDGRWLKLTTTDDLWVVEEKLNLRMDKLNENIASVLMQFQNYSKKADEQLKQLSDEVQLLRKENSTINSQMSNLSADVTELKILIEKKVQEFEQQLKNLETVIQNSR